AKRASLRMGVFEKAMSDFKSDFPQFAKKGWGVTVKSERWNGRHAMAGWLIIWITAYMKGHGMLPSGILEPSVWGPLAQLGGYEPIPRERAVVLIANVHLLLVSVAATIAPFSFQDKLLLDEGESDEAPAGLIPSFKLGLTKEAELWNGRLAMLGLIVIVFASVSSGTSILDLTNQMFGNA
nr:Chain 82, RedCAP [Porphyridium purpureum]7Y5E_8N Chain 8N, RedCAP [Porphyridium purpureum]7Y7A_87 Chain 87, RedCAP [Porphyridium purpureum]7Y7A_8o Chain 8o, RedCAP [Porphyridium purpureum]